MDFQRVNEGVLSQVYVLRRRGKKGHVRLARQRTGRNRDPLRRHHVLGEIGCKCLRINSAERGDVAMEEGDKYVKQI